MNYNQLVRRYERLNHLLTVVENSWEHKHGRITMATVELREVIKETLQRAQEADHQHAVRIQQEANEA